MEEENEFETINFDKPDFAITTYTAEHTQRLWGMGASVSKGQNNILHVLKLDKPQYSSAGTEHPE